MEAVEQTYEQQCVQGTSPSFESERGSFRDRSNRVYYWRNNQVVRGISADALSYWDSLAREPFFERMMAAGAVVTSQRLGEDHAITKALSEAGWAGVLEHARVPFVSYPYEWTFGMLKDAALLHLDILERALEHGWTLKDATAYNVQWIGAKPTFIDVTSFEWYRDGDPWVGYRQFCMMFLNPLLLKAHRGIDYSALLRGDLEGIDPTQAIKLFPKTALLKKGVFSHVYLHAKSLNHFARKEKAVTSDTPTHLRHSKAMVLGLVQGLRRTVASLRSKEAETVWGNYEDTHSYDDSSYADKKAFVTKHVQQRRWSLAWDLGCNTGTFSKLCSPYSDTVVSMDGDWLAIERLYQRQKKEAEGNILPLVMNLSNVSPNHGWQGKERKSLVDRGKPDLVLCLALIHHMAISANIPMREFLEWLRSLGAATILEFVGPEDEMTRQLLRNKVNQYSDYTVENFEREVKKLFQIGGQIALKGGKRCLYYLEPK